MFVQMLQMTCLGVKDGFCSLNYLTWKFDSPRGISFHQPKTIKKTIQQTVLQFYLCFLSNAMFGIKSAAKYGKFALDFVISSTRSGSMNMQLSWRIRIAIHWAFVCPMVFRNAKEGIYEWWDEMGLEAGKGWKRAELVGICSQYVFPTMNLMITSPGILG